MSNLRARFVSSEPLLEGGYRRMCFMYTAGQKYCNERASVRVTVRIAYERCCLKAPVCACGVYAEIDLCESHARQYEGKEEHDSKTA
jgi:hypothetical protein